MNPHPKNFCGGNYADWLEVNLLPECNAKCSWCIEKQGWHPPKRVSANQLVGKILESDKKNIILLGGEPTLYNNLEFIIRHVSILKNVYITTNGSKLTHSFCQDNLIGISGINISIHHYCLLENQAITGLRLYDATLKESIATLKRNGANVRFNCNLIAGKIDDADKILKYIDWAHRLGADEVRFAELKFDEDNFVDMTKILAIPIKDPFVDGCCYVPEEKISGMKVSYRLMCGFNVACRPQHDWPKFAPKKVLYYDGNFYDGWQTKVRNEMPDNEKLLAQLFQDLYDRKITPIEAALKIHKYIEPEVQVKETVKFKDVYVSSPCVY